MKLQFIGTAAAEGVPAAYCKCEVCQTARTRGEKELRGRSQCLIDGCLGIDYPPDAYMQAERFQIDLTKVNHLLITHSHMDHFYAHDFILRGYKYTKTPLAPLHIYGNEEVKKVFDECTRRELRKEVKENIIVHTLRPFAAFTIENEGGRYTITPLLAQHSVAEEALLYLIEKGEQSYLHLTDTGRLPLSTLTYLQSHFSGRKNKLSLITFDCTFLFYEAGEVSRHMGLEDNKAMLSWLKENGVADEKTRCAITHFSHNSNPLQETLERANKQYGYFAAYDGATLTID